MDRVWSRPVYPKQTLRGSLLVAPRRPRLTVSDWHTESRPVAWPPCAFITAAPPPHQPPTSQKVSPASARQPAAAAAAAVACSDARAGIPSAGRPWDDEGRPPSAAALRPTTARGPPLLWRSWKFGTNWLSRRARWENYFGAVLAEKFTSRPKPDLTCNRVQQWVIFF